jgi:hypothetical protein
MNTYLMRRSIGQLVRLTLIAVLWAGPVLRSLVPAAYSAGVPVLARGTFSSEVLSLPGAGARFKPFNKGATVTVLAVLTLAAALPWTHAQRLPEVAVPRHGLTERGNAVPSLAAKKELLAALEHGKLKAKLTSVPLSQDLGLTHDDLEQARQKVVTILKDPRGRVMLFRHTSTELFMATIEVADKTIYIERSLFPIFLQRYPGPLLHEIAHASPKHEQLIAMANRAQDFLVHAPSAASPIAVDQATIAMFQSQWKGEIQGHWVEMAALAADARAAQSSLFQLVNQRIAELAQENGVSHDSYVTHLLNDALQKPEDILLAKYMPLVAPFGSGENVSPAFERAIMSTCIQSWPNHFLESLAQRYYRKNFHMNQTETDSHYRDAFLEWARVFILHAPLDRHGWPIILSHPFMTPNSFPNAPSRPKAFLTHAA